MFIQRRALYNIVLLFIVIVLGMQCKEDNPIKKEINFKHDEIMVIHDEVMPKMKDIHQLKKKLKKMKDDEGAKSIIELLEQADETMMDWMAQYKKPKSNNAEYRTYLSGQLELVKIVKNDMNTSISKAKEYLN